MKPENADVVCVSLRSAIGFYLFVAIALLDAQMNYQFLYTVIHIFALSLVDTSGGVVALITSVLTLLKPLNNKLVSLLSGFTCAKTAAFTNIKSLVKDTHDHMAQIKALDFTGKENFQCLINRSCQIGTGIMTKINNFMKAGDKIGYAVFGAVILYLSAVVDSYITGTVDTIATAIREALAALSG